MSMSVQLSWTNPPEADLKSMRFTAYCTSLPDTTYTEPMPEYFGRDGVIIPGARDSLSVALPCRTVQTTWQFACWAVDTAGNVSARSNVATVAVPH